MMYFATSNTLEARAQLVDKARKDKGRFDDPMSIFETNLEIVGDTMHLAYIRENEGYIDRKDIFIIHLVIFHPVHFSLLL